MGFNHFDDIEDGDTSDNNTGTSDNSNSGNSGYDAQGGQIKDSNIGSDISGTVPDRGLSTPSNLDPEDFPVYSIARPYAVFAETDDGIEFRTDADVTGVEMERSWYTSPWEYADKKPGEWLRVFWSEHEFRRIEHIVEDQTHLDLREVISDNPENAHKLITRAVKDYSNPEHTGPSNMRECPVCGADIDVTSDEYEEVENKAICTDHSIEEVVSAGFLQD